VHEAISFRHLYSVQSLTSAREVGALGSWGAALLDPYSDNTATNGIMRISPEKLAKLVKGLWNDGWQIVRVFAYPRKAGADVVMSVRISIVSGIGRTKLYWTFSRK